MVYSTLIEANGKIGKYSCLPETNEDQRFELVIDFENEEVLRCTTKEVGYTPYKTHAVYGLIQEYMRTQEIPKKLTSAWY